MNIVEMLIQRYPKLYHMAESRNWDNICKHGLLSTTALLDLFEYDKRRRFEIESQLRLKEFRITHPVYGEAFIRDQHPMHDRPHEGIYLKNCLVGITLREWLELLNRKTFFWADQTGLTFMLGARLYRQRSHSVITVDTRKLLDRHPNKVTITSLNSGSLYGRNAREKRSKDIFKPITEYNQMRWVSEFAVEYSVPDIADLMISVDECISRRENNTRVCKVLRRIRPP